MIKRNIIKALLVCFTIQMQAQGNLPGGFNHIIEVGRYSDYGKGYLTITDFNEVVIKIDDSHCRGCYYTFEYTDEYKSDYDSHLNLGELILEVDGVSAAGWTKEQFYQKVDNRHDIITLKIKGKKEKGIYEYVTKIRPLYELPDDVKVFGNIFATVKGQTQVERRKSKKGNGGLTADTSFEERHDEDFDFFPCVYYDYLLNSSDPILDKEVLKEVGTTWNINRNDSIPNLLLTIARDANESISSTYIPPSSRVVNDGSFTEARYNALTKRTEYVTTQKNRVIQEGGYTQETKTADVFLEIAALDVKRLNDPNINYPPVVWKATAKRHVLNPSQDFSLIAELEALASWMCLPPFDRHVGVWPRDYFPIYAPVGIYWGEDFNTIQSIMPGSRAEKIGLRPGDKLVSAKVSNKYRQKTIKANLKKRGWGVTSLYYDDTYNIVVLRNGNKINFTLKPVSIEGYRRYWVGAK